MVPHCGRSVKQSQEMIIAVSDQGEIVSSCCAALLQNLLLQFCCLQPARSAVQLFIESTQKLCLTYRRTRMELFHNHILVLRSLRRRADSLGSALESDIDRCTTSAELCHTSCCSMGLVA